MNNSREKIIPYIIFLLLLVVYIGFPTKNYYWDGIEFAQIIENAGSLNTSLLHPNHLFYNALGYIIYKCVLGLGFEARAVTVLQITNSILSALSAFVLFHILKRSFRSVYLAASLTFIFSFSALWWKFSTDADSYIPSILFMITGFYFILPDQKPRPLPAALIHTIAMCFHQLAVFFFPVVILGLFFQARALPARKRWLMIAQYGFAAFLLTFGIYYISFYLQTGNLDFKALSGWLTSYSPENGFVFSLKDCFKHTLNGEVKLFFGGRFSYLREAINPLTILLMGLLVAAFAGLIFQIIRLRKTNRGTEKPVAFIEFKPLALLCGVWTAVYLAFLFFWIPQNTFYRMFYLPALVILIGILLNKYRIPGRIGWRTLLFAVIVAISNFLFYIYPYARVRPETPFSMALEMKNVWRPNTVIYYSKLESDNRLVRYFNPSTTWIKLEDVIKPEEFEAQVQKIYDGGEAWLDTSAVGQFMKQEASAQWLTEHSAGQPRHKVNDPAYDVIFVKIAP